MKYLTILFAFIIVVVSGCASNRTGRNAIVSEDIKVMGSCAECKEGIEDAALFSSGVKAATWNPETQMLSVVYEGGKASTKAIHKAVTNAGYSTNLLDGNEEAMAELPDCCKKSE